jgi:hypothetical protein
VPRMAKAASTKEFTNKVLKEARRILADSNPQVVQVPFEDFAHIRLPDVDSDVLSKIMGNLRDANGGGLTSDGVMWGYSDMTPATHTNHTTAAFGSLCRFVSLTIKFGLQHNGAEAWLTHKYKQAPITSPGNTSRPDSYIYLTTANLDKLGWHDLLMLAEYKIYKKDHLEVHFILFVRNASSYEYSDVG